MPLFSSTSIIHELIGKASWTELAAHLVKSPQSASSKDKDGNLPIHCCIRVEGPVDTLEALLKLYPTSLKIKNNEGLTPLHLGCMYNLPLPAFKVLFSHAPKDASIVDVSVEKKGSAQNGWNCIHFLSSYHTDPNVVSYIISLSNNLITQKDSLGKLPLHYAVADKSKELQFAVRLQVFLSFPVVEYLDDELVASICASLTKELSTGTSIKNPNLLTAWCCILAYDKPPNKFEKSIDKLLNDNPDQLQVLTKQKSPSGKSPLESSNPTNFKILTRHMLFCGHYVLSEVVHRGVNNLLIVAKDLQGVSDYKAIYSAFLEQWVIHCDKVKKERDGEAVLNVDEREAKVDAAERDKDIDPTKLPKSKIMEAVNMLGFGISPTQFDTIFSKWDSNNDNSMDDTEFVSMIKKDLDDNKPRNVVIKFMRDRSKFYNELGPRLECDLSSRYVMSLLKRFDESGNTPDDIAFSEDILKNNKLLYNSATPPKDNYELFKCAFIMPRGTLSLTQFYLQQRPADTALKNAVRQVGDCIRYVHDKGMIHGDIKMNNVIMFNDIFRLIDLDSSIVLNNKQQQDTQQQDDGFDKQTVFYGRVNSFSSALVPPEMLHKFTDMPSIESYNKYWGSECNARGIKPVLVGDSYYCFKQYKTDDNDIQSESLLSTSNSNAILDPLDFELLPYKVLEASNVYDIWCYGMMLYNLLTSETLFKCDVNDCLTDGGYSDLIHYNDDVKERLVISKVYYADGGGNGGDDNVDDNDHGDSSDVRSCYEVIDLLLKLLSHDVKDRYKSMSDVMKHCYFTDPDTLVEGSDAHKQYLHDKRTCRANVRNVKNRIESADRMKACLIKAKSVVLSRISDADVLKFDNSVSTVINNVLLNTHDSDDIGDSSKFNIPKAFVVLPIVNEKVKNDGSVWKVWTNAIDNIVSLVNGNNNGSNDSNVKIDSIRSEFLNALKYYGEGRYGLYWIDEYDCKMIKSDDDNYNHVIEMSFLNALRFMPLMITSLKILSKSFTPLQISNLFNITVDMMPKFLYKDHCDVNAVDLAYEFDDFQGHIDDYGAYLEELEKVHSTGNLTEESHTDDTKTEGSKNGEDAKTGDAPNTGDAPKTGDAPSKTEEIPKDAAAAAEPSLANAPSTPTASSKPTPDDLKILANERKRASVASPIPNILTSQQTAQSPFVLRQYSHTTQLKHFDDFVMSRDKEFHLSSLRRVQLPLNSNSCMWTSESNLKKIEAAALPEEVKKRKADFEQLTKSLENREISIVAHKSTIKQLHVNIHELKTSIAKKNSEIENLTVMKEALLQSSEGLENNNFEKIQKIKVMSEEHNATLKAVRDEKDNLVADLTKQIEILQKEMKERMEEKEAQFLKERYDIEDNLKSTNKSQREAHMASLDEKEKELEKQKAAYDALQKKLQESHEKFQEEIVVTRQTHEQQLEAHAKEMKLREENKAKLIREQEEQHRREKEALLEERNKELKAKEDLYEREVSTRGRLETFHDDLEKKLDRSDSQLLALEERHEMLENQSRDYLMECKVKDNRINVLKTRTLELEQSLADVVADVAESKKRARELEQIKLLVGKRDTQLTAKIKECDKKQGMIDQKDAEIGKLRRQIRMGGGSTVADDELVVLELQGELSKKDAVIKAQAKELGLLRSMVSGNVRNAGSGVQRGGAGGEGEEEEEDVIGNVGKKLQDMQAEIGKIQRIVHEGEKYKKFLKNLKELGIEASSYEEDHKLLDEAESEDRQYGSSGQLEYGHLTSPMKAMMDSPQSSGSGNSPLVFFSPDRDPEAGVSVLAARIGADERDDDGDSISSVESGDADSPVSGQSALSQTGGNVVGGISFPNWNPTYDGDDDAADGDSDEAVISPRATLNVAVALPRVAVPGGAGSSQRMSDPPRSVLRKSSFSMDPNTDMLKRITGRAAGDQEEKKAGSPRTDGSIPGSERKRLSFRDTSGSGDLADIAQISECGEKILFSPTSSRIQSQVMNSKDAPPKPTAISTPTRVAGKKLPFVDGVKAGGESVGASGAAAAAAAAMGEGGGRDESLQSMAPSPPTDTSVLEHKRRVRSLVFGVRLADSLNHK
jgi:serine/threonine protein kinase